MFENAKESLDAITDLTKKFLEIWKHCKDIFDGSLVLNCSLKRELIEFYQYSFIPSFIFLIILSFFTKRQTRWPNLYNGRPGIVIPMDFVSQKRHKILFIITFCITSYFVINIMEIQYPLKNIFVSDLPYSEPIIKIILKLISVVVYGLVLYPLIASICHNTLTGMIIGTVYIWAYTIFNFKNMVNCRRDQVTLTLKYLPLFIVCVILSLAFPIKAIKMIRSNKGIRWTTSPRDETTIEVATVYVRQLFNKTTETKIEDFTGFAKLKYSLGLHSLKEYNGIQYPTIFLCSIFSCVILLYAIVYKISQYIVEIDVLVNKNGRLIDNKDPRDIKSVFEHVQTIPALLTNLTKIKEEFSNNKFQEVKLIFLDFFRLAGYLLETTKICLILAVIVSVIINLIHIPFMLINYKHNMLEIYNGTYSQVNRRKIVGSNAGLLLGYSRFAGYQIMYYQWGFLLQFFAIFFGLLIFFLTVITPLKNGFGQFWTELFRKNWPILLSVPLLIIVQNVVVKYCFTQDRGKTFAIENRKGFFIWVYFMFFYNVFLGIVSVILRIVKFTIFGVAFLSRIDHPVLAKKFEFQDPGWKAYQSYLHVQHQHSNPTMLLFIHFLQQSTLEYDLCTSSENNRTTAQEKRMKNIENSKNFDQQRRKKQMIFQWYVLYTLIHNPGLVILRKHNMDSRNERLRAKQALQMEKRK